MEYIKATEKDLEQILTVVQETIQTVYPKYYPKEVVSFFSKLHNKDNIFSDIKAGHVGVLKNEDEIIGTGSYSENHITRLYVKPIYQNQGYGSYIMQCLEDEISKSNESVYLDASLPACHLYEKRGYHAVKHERLNVGNDVVLVYEIMEKRLTKCSTNICYDGKNFIPFKNAENGEVDEETLFTYHQYDNVLWAEYSGGEIIRGNLVGTVDENGELDFYYQHLNEQKHIRIGICHSVPRILENGKIQLTEKWQWLNGDKTKGTSIIVEK